MQVLLLGASGLLGTDMRSEVQSRGWSVADPRIDVSNPEDVARVSLGEYGRFDWIVNCAGYTHVDRAEDEQDEAALVNSLGPAYLAQACHMMGARLLHFSTDYVFDGACAEPYDEDAAPRPLSVYGRTKWDGELAVGPAAIVARTAWLFGPGGACFAKKIAAAWLSGAELRVVSDQTGSPSYTAEVARMAADLVAMGAAPGVYHLAGSEPMSWHAFATACLSTYQEVHGPNGHPVEIRAIETADWPTPARRPPNSGLRSSRLAALGVRPHMPIADALREFWARTGPL